MGSAQALGKGLMRKIIAGLLAITIAAISIEGAVARKRDHRILDTA
jgi:hypothetical protein